MTDQTIDTKKHFVTARWGLIDKPLKDFGFKPYKTSVLGRLTDDNVFQFIDFHNTKGIGHTYTAYKKEKDNPRAILSHFLTK